MAYKDTQMRMEPHKSTEGPYLGMTSLSMAARFPGAPGSKN